MTMKPVWQTHLASDAPLDDEYHATPRVEIASFFDSPPGVVVDVGCGAGATGGLLKRKFPGTRVIGIERNARVAALARAHLDDVVCADLADVRLDEHLGGRPVGALLLLDVLEHLADPWRALVAMRGWLAPTSRVIASVPNVRNLRTLEHIASGHFDYDERGVLDVTHLRFFTRSTLRRMLEETGYEVVAIEALPHPAPGDLSVERGATWVRTPTLEVRCGTLADLEDLHAFQLVAEARLPATELRR
jgi:O-antigen biosynthesis protein